MKKSIIVDMDEVIACYTEKVISTFKKETGFSIDREKTKGRFLSQSLDKEAVEIVSSYPYRKGFFRDLNIMPDSQRVIKNLCEYYDIAVATSCLQHPNSIPDKLAWLDEYFPFIPYQKIILCGEKKYLCADFLIDDHPRHLENFRGMSLMFSAFHNTEEKRFKRFNNWPELEDFLMKEWNFQA
jgi:5'-nucleotidase